MSLVAGLGAALGAVNPASWVIGGASLLGSMYASNKSNKSVDKTNSTNIKLANETNYLSQVEADRNRVFQADQAAKERYFQNQEAKKAFDRQEKLTGTLLGWQRLEAFKQRQWDRAQVVEAQKYDTETALAAEKRGREYTAEDREYNSPAATRARLEAAGYNPLTGVDPSTGVVGSGAFLPAGSGIASAQLASAQAAQVGAAGGAGIPSGAQAAFVTPQLQAKQYGNALGEAVQVAAAFDQEQKRQALQATQIEMENQRIQEIINDARNQPRVDGPYQATARSVATGNVAPQVMDTAPEFAGVAAGLYDNRDQSVEPVMNLPTLMDVELPSGRTVPALNTDLELEGPAAWANSAWIGGAASVDSIYSATGMYDAGERLLDKALDIKGRIRDAWVNEYTPNPYSAPRPGNTWAN